MFGLTLTANPKEIQLSVKEYFEKVKPVTAASSTACTEAPNWSICLMTIKDNKEIDQLVEQRYYMSKYSMKNVKYSLFKIIFISYMNLGHI